MKRYDPKEIEPKWQQIWEETGLYQTPEHPGADKYYCLVMFPYPSGDLHSGHWYNFGPGDTVARFHRMQGQKVLHPMGFDAFGLPAENAAIKRHIPPTQWTKQNIAGMTKQLKRLGTMYDWDRVVDTSRPDYYKWTQWLFLNLYQQGLAYRAKGWQNWCPKDQTVLANEQVVGENNVCERCGTPVIKKDLEQWFFKITDYADRLLTDLDKVHWPERVKTMQENWIGRSEGTLIKFSIVSSSSSDLLALSRVEGIRGSGSPIKSGNGDMLDGNDWYKGRLDSHIEVFTTRIDTIFSGTFVVLAPEHPLVGRLTTPPQKRAVEDYIKKTAHKTELDRLEETGEKTGVFTGSYVINPATGAEIPVWVADFVLASYGTGAVFGDGHDDRDAEFARKYNIPLSTSIEPITGKKQENPDHNDKIVAVVEDDDGRVLTINWGPKLGGRLTIGGTVEPGESLISAARREIAEETGYTDLELLEQGDETVHHEYFAHSKGMPFVAHTTLFHFRLKSDKRNNQNLDESEHGNFEVEWVNKSVVEAEVVDELHRYGYDKFIHNKPWTGDGLLYNSGQFDGLTSVTARTQITAWLAEQGKAEASRQYRIRDWLISRQRYWGPPIPIIYCNKCGVVPVPEDQLPVVLPLDVEFEPTGRSPLANRPDFYKTTCPQCGGPARRETDTLDTFVDSSWYFLRYPNNHYDQGPFDPVAVKEWAPVDQYMGGVEHAILHLLYARFITKTLYDQKMIGFDEPFKSLFNQGIILGPDGQKMSKSRGNVVNPDDWVDKYGADTFRMYLMFMGPYDQGGPFNVHGIGGVSRFLHRVWALVQEYIAASGEGRVASKEEIAARPLDARNDNETPNSPLAAALVTTSHKTIKRVTQDIEDFGFNTAVAALMELVNEYYKLKVDLPLTAAPAAWGEALTTLLQLLAPLAPHITEELWQQLGQTESIHRSHWPRYSEELVREEMVDMAVQVNGKLRGVITLAVEADEATAIKAAQTQEAVAKYLHGQKLTKTIVVPRKLVNFVTKLSD